jgi:hypothetical protein
MTQFASKIGKTVLENVTFVVSQAFVPPVVPPVPVFPPVLVVTVFPGKGPLKLSHETTKLEHKQIIRTIKIILIQNN